MRIMEIVSGTAVNGAVVTCLEMTRALRERGHRFTLVCRPRAWIADELRNDDIDIVYSDLRRWPIDELRRITALAREKQVELLHTHMSSANFFGVLMRRLSGIPCVATANNRHIQLHWMFNDHVVAASEATRRYHRRFNLVRSKRIEVVHNFINDQRFRSAPNDAGLKFREELRIDKHALLIGVVGDVVERKGLVYLIRALPSILREVPNAHVVSVGFQKEHYTKVVRREIDRLNMSQHVTLAGNRSDIVNAMAALDLFVLPTLEDNLPLAILEAMASGVPVVASHVGGIPECVVPEQTGLLLPPAQPDRLASALISLLKDESRRSRFGAAARQRIRENFSRQSQTRRMEQVLQKCISASKRRAA